MFFRGSVAVMISSGSLEGTKAIFSVSMFLESVAPLLALEPHPASRLRHMAPASRADPAVFRVETFFFIALSKVMDCPFDEVPDHDGEAPGGLGASVFPGPSPVRRRSSA